MRKDRKLSVFPTVQVSEQLVRMEVWLRQQRVASLSFPQVRVNDGEWHHLLVELRSVKDSKDIKYIASVSLDYDMYQVQVTDITNTVEKNGLRFRDKMF